MTSSAPPAHTSEAARSTGGRWRVALFVVLAAAGAALLLEPREPPPSPAAPEAVADGRRPDDSRALAGDPERTVTRLDWPDAPELSRRYELAAGRRLALELNQGDIEVRTGDEPGAGVEVELGDGDRPPREFEWSVEERGDELLVRIRSRSRGSWLGRLLGLGSGDEGRPARVTRVILSLPADVPLRLSTGAGGVRVSDRQAALDVETGAGDVELARLTAAVEVQAGAGDVRAVDLTAAAEIRTGAGEIQLEGALGELKLSSGAGDVRFAGEPKSVTVETGAGGVSGRLDVLRGPVAVQTGMGGIELAIPDQSSCTLRAESGLGTVTAELDGTRFSAERGRPLEIQRGNGHPIIDLSTGTGAIRVRTAASAGGS